jgi:hypothetical protein
MSPVLPTHPQGALRCGKRAWKRPGAITCGNGLHKGPRPGCLPGRPAEAQQRRATKLRWRMIVRNVFGSPGAPAQGVVLRLGRTRVAAGALRGAKKVWDTVAWASIEGIGQSSVLPSRLQVPDSVSRARRPHRSMRRIPRRRAAIRVRADGYRRHSPAD